MRGVAGLPSTVSLNGPPIAGVPMKTVAGPFSTRPVKCGKCGDGHLVQICPGFPWFSEPRCCSST